MTWSSGLKQALMEKKSILKITIKRKKVKTILVIYLAAAIIIFTLLMVAAKITHKVFLSMRRQERKFNQEENKDGISTTIT